MVIYGLEWGATPERNVVPMKKLILFFTQPHPYPCFVFPLLLLRSKIAKKTKILQVL